jgi:hypothetical protein
MFLTIPHLFFFFFFFTEAQTFLHNGVKAEAEDILPTASYYYSPKHQFLQVQRPLRTSANHPMAQPTAPGVVA